MDDMPPRAMLACSLACAVLLDTPPAAAQDEAARQLTVDRGCINCHGEPPRRNIRSFAQIRGSYASSAGQPGAESRALDRFHHGPLFSHIAAHESLSEEEAAAVIRWLFAGAAAGR